jgi:chemotaxis protein methyltransferase CheR
VTGPDPQLLDLAREVTARTGLAFAGLRRRTLLARLEDVVTAAPRTGAARCRAALEGRDDATFDQLTSALTVGETYFFRERRHFELLARHVLPELVGQRPPDHRLRVWSAGCATGEELYTLAFVLADAGLAGRTTLIGTDLSRDALRRAAAGRYSRWSLRGMTGSEIQRHLRRVGPEHEVPARVRARAQLSVHNLVDPRDPAPPGGEPVDVLFCRNVLIYLAPEAVEAAGRRLVAALAPGGWLFTASSDPPLVAEGLERVRTPDGFAYRRRGPGLGSACSPTTGAAIRTLATEAVPGRPAATVPGPAGRVAPRRGAGPAGPATKPAGADTRLDAARRCLEAAHHLDAGRWSEAATAARAAAFLAPDDAEAHALLGHARRRLGQHAAAERSLRTAAALAAGDDRSALGAGAPRR